MAGGGLTGERGGALYRKRKPIPAIIIVALLGVAAVVVWTKVIAKDSDVNAVVACSPSSKAPATVSGQPVPQLGQPLAHNALDKVTPTPPGDVQVRVVNSSNQRGEAQQVSTALTDLGFKQAAQPADDPLYPNHDMKCEGQIRFGANGEAAARTLSLVLPCTQLVRDERQDGTVDVAVGSNFTQVLPNTAARQALQQLSAWAAQHPAPQGGQQAQGSLAPQISPALLSNAHDVTC